LLCGWLTEIWLLTAVAAALVNAVATVVPDWHIESLRWLAVLEDGGFEFCYGLLGLYATRQLRWEALLIDPDDELRPGAGVGMDSGSGQQ
jgi:hypothetical protein